MVATTFAVDTPLAVTGFVTQHGIAGNWVWWSSVMSGILTVFFFAKLWRRSGVLTDVEFIELRYSGKAAAALRLVRALFQGVFVNTVIMGWVNLAMAKVLELTLHVPKLEALAACLVFTGRSYVTIGGLWGVLVTDLLQFVVKMTMAIVLAVAAVAAVGGIPSLEAKLAALDAAASRSEQRLDSRVLPHVERSVAAAAHVLHLHRRAVVGVVVSRRGARRRRLHRAAHLQRARARTIRCSPRSSSTSRTTRCGRGRGFSSRSPRSCSIRTASPDPTARSIRSSTTSRR